MEGAGWNIGPWKSCPIIRRAGRKAGLEQFDSDKILLTHTHTCLHHVTHFFYARTTEGIGKEGLELNRVWINNNNKARSEEREQQQEHWQSCNSEQQE